MAHCLAQLYEQKCPSNGFALPHVAGHVCYSSNLCWLDKSVLWGCTFNSCAWCGPGLVVQCWGPSSKRQKRMPASGALALFFSFPVPDIGWETLDKEEGGSCKDISEIILANHKCLRVFRELTAGGRSAMLSSGCSMIRKNLSC